MDQFFKTKVPFVIIILLAAFFLRLILSALPSFEFDESAFRFWSQRLFEVGPANFYSPDVFTNNPLGYLYFLWAIGYIKQSILPSLAFTSTDFDFFLKLPANIADLVSSVLIFYLIKKKLGEKFGMIASLLYILNPVVIFNSSIWGQYDSLAFVFILLSTIFLVNKKIPELAAVFFAIAYVVKPQSLSFAPALGLAMLTQSKPLRISSSAGALIVTSLLLFIPFFPNDPLGGFFYVNFGSAELFSCTTCFAFNFWGIFGNWQDDNKIFLVLPLLIWGLVLTATGYLITFFKKPVLSKFTYPLFYLAAAMSTLIFFTFLTRMHERYFFPAIPFLLISAFLLKSRAVFYLFIFFSLLFTINLYLPYAYYNKHLGLPFIDVLYSNFNLFSIFEIAGVLVFTFIFAKIAVRQKNEN